MGDYDGAILDLDRALSIEPANLFIYLARGNVRVASNDYPGAIDDFDRAIEIDPTEPAAYLIRAQTYSKLEDLKQAIDDYQTAANIYLERQDLAKYRDTLDQLQRLQRSTTKSSLQQGKNRSQLEILKQHLRVLVSGQWELAERLIVQLEEKYPGRSEEWYLERVIYELETGF